jgi:hypothetical protein
MNNYFQKFAKVLFISTLLASSACVKKTNTPPSNEEEEINTVRLTLTGNGTTTTYNWKDLDGPAGNLPVADTVRLAPSTQYQCDVSLVNQSNNVDNDLTPEIRNESNEHQLFFAVEGNRNLTVVYNPNDFDNNTPPKPIGLRTNFATTIPGNGSLKVVLRHQPDLKQAITNTLGDSTLGDTDVEIRMPYKVQ